MPSRRPFITHTALIKVAQVRGRPEMNATRGRAARLVEANARLTGATGLWCCLTGRELG